MKIRTDEHVSPQIVKAIREISLTPKFEISSVLEVCQQGAPDTHWITKFSRENGAAILTADRDFFTLEPQINAVFDTGMKVIHLPSKWGQAKGYLQAAHVLQWWARIETQLVTMAARECYRPEWNIRETGEMRRVKIDFAKAQRLRRRAKKHSK